MAVNRAATAIQLNELKGLLSRALEVADDLVGDPQVERMLQAFARLPGPDREPILRVLERDATWCRIAEQTSDTTGITVRPNPHASLYVQVMNQLPDGPLQRDVDVIRFGLEQFVALLPFVMQEDVRAQWTVSAREIIRDADPAVLAHAAQLARHVLALLDERGNGAPANGNGNGHAK